jgi:uroporphyrin-III C-methyltransferase/precorrin-2 dehydrogenase/sirohydrochlorin ferrochelatase
VQAELGNQNERRMFWQTVFDGPVSSDILSGDMAAAEESMRAMLNQRTVSDGEAWIVGAGPGDPELLTLKAARALRDADVILHDRLVAPAILDMARKDAEFISVGKQAGKPSISQDEINKQLVELVTAGHRVCRLKGGDPFIFGRGGEEIAALEAAGLRWQVVPGITAASGCAAATGIPLTHRHTARSLLLTTASTADDDGDAPDWQALSRPEQTVVFYMGVSKTGSICSNLIDAGQSPACPAAIIENGCTPRQRVITGTLESLPQLAENARITSPALLIIGEVAALAVAPTQDEASTNTSPFWSAAANT